MLTKLFWAALMSMIVLAFGRGLTVADDNEMPVSSATSPSAPAAAGAGLTGRVLAPSGEPIAQASVLVQSLDKPAPAVPELAIMTGPDGRYFWPLPAGRWEVRVITLGGAEAAKTIATRKSGKAVLDFTLSP